MDKKVEDQKQQITIQYKDLSFTFGGENILKFMADMFIELKGESPFTLEVCSARIERLRRLSKIKEFDYGELTQCLHWLIHLSAVKKKLQFTFHTEGCPKDEIVAFWKTLKECGFAKSEFTISKADLEKTMDEKTPILTLKYKDIIFTMRGEGALKVIADMLIDTESDAPLDILLREIKKMEKIVKKRALNDAEMKQLFHFLIHLSVIRKKLQFGICADNYTKEEISHFATEMYKREFEPIMLGRMGQN